MQYLCLLMTSLASVLLISKIMQLNYILILVLILALILVLISGWLFPSSLKEYPDIWIIFVSLVKYLMFDGKIPHLSLQNLMISLSSSLKNSNSFRNSLYFESSISQTNLNQGVFIILNFTFSKIFIILTAVFDFDQA